jgi:hypothetical protein
VSGQDEHVSETSESDTQIDFRPEFGKILTVSFTSKRGFPLGVTSIEDGSFHIQVAVLTPTKSRRSVQEKLRGRLAWFVRLVKVTRKLRPDLAN